MNQRLTDVKKGRLADKSRYVMLTKATLDFQLHETLVCFLNSDCGFDREIDNPQSLTEIAERLIDLLTCTIYLSGL